MIHPFATRLVIGLAAADVVYRILLRRPLLGWLL